MGPTHFAGSLWGNAVGHTNALWRKGFDDLVDVTDRSNDHPRISGISHNAA